MIFKKYFLLLYFSSSILFTSNTHSSCVETSNSSLANEEILKLTCLSQDISAALIDGKEVVPSTIYHYGKKEHLDEDIKARTIPPYVWDKFIMNGESRFSLHSSRRGLYGTSGLDTNWYGGNGYEWLMQIEIKPECRKPKRVADISVLDKDKRFISWFAKSSYPTDIKKSFATRCNMGDKLNLPEQICEDIVTHFLDDNKIAIVHDHVENKSFYIRDRSCINTIRGTPEEWIQVFTEQPNLWIQRCKGISRIDLMLFKSLVLTSEKIPNSDQLLKNVKLFIAGNENSSGVSRIEFLEEAIKAKKRCDEKNNGEFSRYVMKVYDGSVDYNAAHLPSLEELKNLCL